jgi:hypothetical protein
MVMQRLFVDSEVLRSIGYSEMGRIMEVEFENGSVRQYYSVPPDIYDGFLDAPVQDNYFDDFVKSNYISQLIH